jgi:hypothetical protein
MILTSTCFLRRPSNCKASRDGCGQYLLPRAKVESFVGDCYNDFPPHDLPFHMRIGIIPAPLVQGRLSPVRLWRYLFAGS